MIIKIVLLSLLLLLPNNKSLESSDKNCLQLDVLLVGDISASTFGKQQFIADAFETFINRFDLDPDSDSGIKIGIMLFSERAYPLTVLTSNKDVLQYAIDDIRNIPVRSNTNMTLALKESINILETFGRPEFKKVIILISDGEADNIYNATIISSEIKNGLPNYYICGILINNYASNPEFMRFISNDFCYRESDYKSLARDLEQLDLCF